MFLFLFFVFCFLIQTLLMTERYVIFAVPKVSIELDVVSRT